MGEHVDITTFIYRGRIYPDEHTRKAIRDTVEDYTLSVEGGVPNDVKMEEDVEKAAVSFEETVREAEAMTINDLDFNTQEDIRKGSRYTLHHYKEFHKQLASQQRKKALENALRDATNRRQTRINAFQAELCEEVMHTFRARCDQDYEAAKAAKAEAETKRFERNAKWKELVVEQAKKGVEPCWKCHGKGKICCNRCSGTGYVNIHTYGGRCYGCNGTGFFCICNACKGGGWVKAQKKHAKNSLLIDGY